MTGKKAAPVRRPRRSNSLKGIQRLLGGAGTTYEDRKERLGSHARYFVKSCKLGPDDNPHVIAGRLTRERWLKAKGESDFNRRLVYPSSGVA